MNKNIVVTGATHNIGCDSPMHRLSVVFREGFSLQSPPSPSLIICPKVLLIKLHNLWVQKIVIKVHVWPFSVLSALEGIARLWLCF